MALPRPALGSLDARGPPLAPHLRRRRHRQELPAVPTDVGSTVRHGAPAEPLAEELRHREFPTAGDLPRAARLSVPPARESDALRVSELSWLPTLANGGIHEHREVLVDA